LPGRPDASPRHTPQVRGGALKGVLKSPFGGLEGELAERPLSASCVRLSGLLREPSPATGTSPYKGSSGTVSRAPMDLQLTQVHVSGLPVDCDDAEVEAALRRALVTRPVNEDARLAAAVAALRVAEAAEGPTQEDDGELRADEAFISCAVVRQKDSLQCKGYCFLTFENQARAEEAILTLNAGVEVAGSAVVAQLSQPKQRHGKPKDAVARGGQGDHDLRLRRKRYQPASKHAIYGHATCSDKSSTVVRTTGRVNYVGGTRGGKALILDDGRCSSRSGFVA